MKNQDTNRNEIHVCFSTDNNYAPYCGVAILSMYQNKNPKDQIHAYILHKDLTEENIEKMQSLAIPGECQVKTVQICEKQFEDMPLPPEFHFTIEAYYRFAIPRIFPELDKMLYLDCDILVRKSLWELYNMDMRNSLLAMVQDANVTGVHYNTGIMLMNCCRWREEDIESALYEYAAKYREKICYVDQDVINGQLAGRILEIEKIWNWQIVLYIIGDKAERKEIVGEGGKEICILHYCSFSKPWEGLFQNTLVDEYFLYLKQIPWKLPDKREEYRGFTGYKYYKTRREIRSFFRRGKIKGNEKTLILYETVEHKEVECAAKDMGIEDVKGYLIKSDDWKQEKWDFLIIEYHNLAIIDHILKRQGYILENQTDRYILLPELTQGIDSNLLAMEYIEYVQQIENANE